MKEVLHMHIALNLEVLDKSRDAGMVVCLERGADLHIAQLMTLPLTISCSRLVLPEWFCFSGAGLGYPGCPGKRPLNECSVVCSRRPYDVIHNHFRFRGCGALP